MSEQRNLWNDDYKRNQVRFSAENALMLMAIVLIVIIGYGAMTQRSYEERKKSELSTMWRGHVDLGSIKVTKAQTWKEQTIAEDNDLYAKDLNLTTGSVTAFRRQLTPAKKDVQVVEEQIPTKAFKEAIAPATGLRMERQ